MLKNIKKSYCKFLVFTRELKFILFKKNNPKIFCVGFNKTGTTTIEATLKEFGYLMGNQKKGELLIKDYENKNFQVIFDFCESAEAFQDVPFSLPNMWHHLYNKFPNAKFILTIREEGDWLNSIIRFHSKLFSLDGAKPKIEDLKSANYRYPGYMYDYYANTFKIDDTKQIYGHEELLRVYNQHNSRIAEFFKERNNLLIIDITKNGSYHKLCEFLGVQPRRNTFPHMNKT
jgi:hypothetical protein